VQGFDQRKKDGTATSHWTSLTVKIANTLWRIRMDELWATEVKLLMVGFLDWAEKNKVYIGEGTESTRLFTLIKMAERLTKEE
jgi:hypothetical protein